MESWVVCCNCFALLYEHNCSLHYCIPLVSKVRTSTNISSFVELSTTAHALLQECSFCMAIINDMGNRDNSSGTNDYLEPIEKHAAQLISSYVEHYFSNHGSLPIHVCPQCGVLYLLEICLKSHEQFHLWQ